MTRRGHLQRLLDRHTAALSRLVAAEVALEVAVREELRRYRQRTGITYRELAERVGVSVGHLQNVQHGSTASPKLAQWLASHSADASAGEGGRDAE